MPEDINRYAAARVPIAAYAEPFGLHFFEQALADADGAILMKCRLIAERAEKELERFARHNGPIGRIIDNQMCQPEARRCHLGSDSIATYMLGPVARLFVPNIISGLMRQGGGKSKIARFCFKGI